MTTLDEESTARRFYWAHRSSGMGGGLGEEELLKHANEPLLAMRELRVVAEQTKPAVALEADECYMLYEYEGTTWSTGQWSQKVFPRAIIVIPRRVRDWGAFSRRFTHLGCEFEVCDHMNVTIFHLEDRVDK